MIFFDAIFFEWIFRFFSSQDKIDIVLVVDATECRNIDLKKMDK